MRVPTVGGPRETPRPNAKAAAPGFAEALRAAGDHAKPEKPLKPGTEPQFEESPPPLPPPHPPQNDEPIGP